MIYLLLLFYLTSPQLQPAGLLPARIYAHKATLQKEKNAFCPAPPDHLVLQRILDKLWEAKGNFSIKKPDIDWGQLQDRPADYSRSDTKQKGLIVVDERTFVVLQQAFGTQARGEDALAVIIAHELIHAFQLADEQNTAAKSGIFGSRKESEADVEGTLIAYLAGYEVFDLIPKIVETLYATFGLKNSATYPSKEERKKNGQVIRNKVQNIAAYLELGNILMSTGFYDLAIRCYKEVNLQFKHKQILNNLAVGYALLALNQEPDKQMQLLYPFSIDARIRFLKAGIGFGGEEENSQLDLAINSRDYLLQALKLDKNNQTTNLNLDCLSTAFPSLLNSGSWQLNPQYTDQYIQHLLLGIKAWKEKKPESARQLWIDLSSDANCPAHLKYIANFNLHVLDYGQPILDDQCRNLPGKVFHTEGAKGPSPTLSLMLSNNCQASIRSDPGIFEATINYVLPSGEEKIIVCSIYRNNRVQIKDWRGTSSLSDWNQHYCKTYLTVSNQSDFYTIGNPDFQWLIQLDKKDEVKAWGSVEIDTL